MGSDVAVSMPGCAGLVYHALAFDRRISLGAASMRAMGSTYRSLISAGRRCSTVARPPLPVSYFLGLPWMHRAKSSLLYGVGDDAAHVTSLIGGSSRAAASARHSTPQS